MREPARSIVTVRSTVALPSFTCARPLARSAGGPSSRSSRAVTVSSSHASPPAHPISTFNGIGTCATAAPAAETRRTLASAGASRVVAIALMGTRSSLSSDLRVSAVASSGGSSRRPSLTTTIAAGRSSGAFARARIAADEIAPRRARAGVPPVPLAERLGRAVAEAEHRERASLPLFSSAAIAASRAVVRGSSRASPGSAINRDASASTTTRAPTTLSRDAMRTGRSTAPRSAASPPRRSAR